MSILSIIARKLKWSPTQPLARSLPSTATQTVAKELGSRAVSQKLVRGGPAGASIDRTEIESIFSAIRQRVPVTLIHGRAGTGKTTLIRRFINESRLNHVVVAPTGVAALNAGGQTIHSFFGLPPRIVNLDEIKPRNKLRTILRRVDFIVIDEISMVRADLLDAVDQTLRINRGANEPFGGVPMLFVGDFLQLPPIVEDADSEILENLGYESNFAFGAKCLRHIVPNVIELTTVHRQTETEFIELLGKLRVGEDVHTTVAALNRLCHRPHRSSAVPVILTARTASAESHNMRGLNALSVGTTSYTAEVTGDFPVRDKRLPAPEFLDLKVGSRVMIVKNHPQRLWVNGSLATVTKLGTKSIWLFLDETRLEHEVTVESWENVKYEWDYVENRVKANVVGTYSQIPVIPAWAITIHKAQGLTLADVRIDLGDGAFSEGQAYVALSRAKSLAGLSFVTPITAGDVRVNSHVVISVERMVARRMG